ncbi:hypothetical protein CLV71_102215 [Actinophytocola oryzae]|uniref:Uncharacterized protein n=1 Tax=Actinophytocola oryzae TaxID=502181 RepID=A0A4R7W2N6_9PSEU|nr:hypothetical protein CLV71_102215 [Actinophytocola oryzae]
MTGVRPGRAQVRGARRPGRPCRRGTVDHARGPVRSAAGAPHRRRETRRTRGTSRTEQDLAWPVAHLRRRRRRDGRAALRTGRRPPGGQHPTPQRIHQPHLLNHPNSAVGLRSTLLIVPGDAVSSFVERHELILAALPDVLVGRARGSPTVPGGSSATDALGASMGFVPRDSPGWCDRPERPGRRRPPGRETPRPAVGSARPVRRQAGNPATVDRDGRRYPSVTTAQLYGSWGRAGGCPRNPRRHGASGGRCATIGWPRAQARA